MRIYGLRIWVEQGYKQVKHELGWADFQVRSAHGILRHLMLVCCAFSFCWQASRTPSGLTSSFTSRSRSRDRRHRPAATAATIDAASQGVLKEIHLTCLEGCERVPVGAAMTTPW